jgi:hypothetical protein
VLYLLWNRSDGVNYSSHCFTHSLTHSLSFFPFIDRIFLAHSLLGCNSRLAQRFQKIYLHLLPNKAPPTLRHNSRPNRQDDNESYATNIIYTISPLLHLLRNEERVVIFAVLVRALPICESRCLTLSPKIRHF